MKDIEAKVERLKAALKTLRHQYGAGKLMLVKQKKRTDSSEVLYAVWTGRHYASWKLARALMFAAGLDPDGKDGVRVEAYLGR